MAPKEPVDSTAGGSLEYYHPTSRPVSLQKLHLVFPLYIIGNRCGYLLVVLVTETYPKLKRTQFIEGGAVFTGEYYPGGRYLQYMRALIY